ncbi:DEAD/DEAH box helicase [Aureimonas altamirensis]|uniref:DEAD/DEAH box helicase n=1 Tax=Aureimonas altamirensis TaxID=370622 RepID=UPI002036777C|nr:DEAD/DEAH box helicase [Aureimonas altamirensis]MCM2505231.1 DEAD/DEAH box helicase [Aureimonas altamirensis]
MPFPATNAALARALATRSYDEPTEVQAAVLRPDAEGRDLLVSAQTGSGKTVAFGLAIASTLLGDAERFEAGSAPLALIIAPTRELALQVHRELTWLYAETGASIATCVGGMDPRTEQRRLRAGCHIVVGTPGRLRDHFERGALSLASLRAVVLDEADEMLDLGFREDLELLLEATPDDRRTLLFSATLPKSIVSLTGQYQTNALRIQTSNGTKAHADIAYKAIRILPNETEHATVNLLRYHDAGSAIVFCNTREAVRRLHASLVERGFTAVALSGELGQKERNAAMQALRDGHARVCVATDVAARGIDLPNLGLVIHAELPSDSETLQHRSGRTGRAGRKGVSVLLVPPARRRKAERLLAEASVRPQWGPAPSPDDIRRKDEERFLSDPVLTGESTEEETALAERLADGRSPLELAAALVRLYRQKLPAAEDIGDPGFDMGKGRPEREGAPAARGPVGETVWFKLGVGRNANADPRWLLPMICRRGKISRQEIGAIRIFERETRFEVAESAASGFAEAARHADGDDAAITPSTAPDARMFSKPPFGKQGKPAYSKSGKPASGKPSFGKPGFGKQRNAGAKVHRKGQAAG